MAFCFEELVFGVAFSFSKSVAKISYSLCG